MRLKRYVGPPEERAMPFRYLDTLTERSVTLRARGRPLTMYVCGPTVYAPTHVGHARTYLYFDLVRRYFEDDGVPLRHLMNITDVEDKIDQRARELGQSPRELARREERRFFRDLDRLNIRPPHYTPRASEFVPAMVRFAGQLARTGRVRPLGTGWFFRPPKRTGHRNFTVARELDRHMVREPADGELPSLDPRDFLVWRRQTQPGLSFQSPWGPGVPGWHLECYAMARRHLGVPVDLQGGGQDLIFPHHYAQNEVALALTGQPFARGFLHTGFVLRDGNKMSKSVGNLVDLADAVEQYGAFPLRWYLLGAPRSESIDWNPREVGQARRRYLEVRETLHAVNGPSIGSTPAAELESLADAVKREIGDDLSVHRAYQRVEGWARRNRRRGRVGLQRGDQSRGRRAIRRIERLTGLALG